jgi:hypothetical protein
MSPIITYAIIFVIILIGIYIFYYYFYLSYNNLNKYKIPLLTDETIFTEDYINNIILATLVSSRLTLYIPKLGYGLTFSWDMYIPAKNGNENWQNNFNYLKPIITFGDSPIISYNPKKNYLSITVKYRNNQYYTQFTELKYTDVRLQKWSQYIVVIENRNVRLFINGKLVLTKHLPSIIIIPELNTHVVLGELNNNFLGKIRNLTLYPYPLSYDEITSISNIPPSSSRSCENNCDKILN